jgi:hypothetical protein
MLRERRWTLSVEKVIKVLNTRSPRRWGSGPSLKTTFPLLEGLYGNCMDVEVWMNTVMLKFG